MPIYNPTPIPSNALPESGRIIANQNFDDIAAALISSSSGAYLNLSGGTITGDTYFTESISANTLSANTVFAKGNITVDSSFVIKSANGGGQIDLDIFGNPGEIMISSDNAGYNGGYVNIADDYLDLYGGSSISNATVSLTRGVQSPTNTYGGVNADTRSNNYQVRLFQSTVNFINGSQGALGMALLGSGSTMPTSLVRGLNMKDNTFFGLTTKNFVNPAIVIGSQNSTVNSGITNSVIIGGSNITANSNNTVYMQNARLAENGGVIYSGGTDLYSIFSKPKFQSLTYAAPSAVTWNYNQGINAIVNLTSITTTISITNAISGDSGNLILTKAVSGCTITLPFPSLVVANGQSAITLTTTASTRDIVSFLYDGTYYNWTYGNNFN